MNTIAVIDYGMGNLHSIGKALQLVAPQARVRITASAEEIAGAQHVVFPGVGAIRDCIAGIARLNLTAAIVAAAQTKPFLGVCVGMQALFTHSEENDGVDCLNLIPGEVCYFGDCPRDPLYGTPLKVPHMGWNEVSQRIAHPLWEGIGQDSRYYFVHSYYARPTDLSCVAGTADYAGPFAAAVCRGKLFAVQFHPEKSHRAGLQLLANFVRWDGSC